MNHSEKKHQHELKRKERRKKKRIHELKQEKSIPLYPKGNGHPFNRKSCYGILSLTKKYIKKQVSNEAVNE